MIIRKATKADSKFMAPILLLAMEEIVYKFLDREDYNSAFDFLFYFNERENNQYSYQNCFVAEDENEIMGVVNIYDGAELHILRNPIIEYIRTHYNADFNPEDETQAGELYIDSLGVNPKYQGKGIGSKILQFLIDEFAVKNNKTLGLLVEDGNPNAKKLYLKLGFKVIGNKTLVGKNLEHLQV